MNRLMTMAVAALAVGFALADEKISMAEHEITSVTVPFGIKNYTPSNKDVVRIEKTGEMQLRLTALKLGRCDLEVRGDTDDVQKYQIDVVPPLLEIKRQLDRELESVPELSTEILGRYIRVDGTVKTVKKWDYAIKVLKTYGAVIHNYATFEPGDDILVRMKETLQQSGFTVAFERFDGEPKSWRANCVGLKYDRSNRRMTVQSRVYTPEQKERILVCLKSERWMHIEEKGKERADDEYKVPADVQIEVAKPVIRMSVAYLAINEEESLQFGNRRAASGDALLLGAAFQTLQNFLHGGGNHGNVANMGVGLSVFATALAESGFAHVKDVGYTTMESWDEKGGSFKTGGTIYAKNVGAATGGGTVVTTSTETDKISYGLEIKTVGGMLNENEMSVDFSFSTAIPSMNAVGDYDVSQTATRQKITCPLGRTTLVGGFKQMEDNCNDPSGVPLLRHIPVLNWLVAADNKSKRDRRLLIMLCPEIVDNTMDASAIQSEVNEEINMEVNLRSEKSALEDKKDSKGWFSGMFNWL